MKLSRRLPRPLNIKPRRLPSPPPLGRARQRASRTLSGGPLDGRWVGCTDGIPCSLPIELHGQAGHYDRGHWVAA